MDEHDSTTKEKPPSVLEKIWARIEEDEAFAYSEFCQALASAELWQHDELVLKLLVARFDITAHWYMYLVPSLMTGKDYVGLLNHFAQGNTGAFGN